MLTEAERYKILVEFNDTKADYPKDKCIHKLFEEQVERTPDAVAAIFENDRFFKICAIKSADPVLFT